MKMVKSLLLGSAAGLVAMAGAQAADLPVKANPVQYVKICSLYGVGFYYIPGTDMCIKVGGWARVELGYGYNGSFTTEFYNLDTANRITNDQPWRAKGTVTFDARSPTEYGTVRSYVALGQSTNNNGDNPSANAGGYDNRWFIQWAGFTIGHASSFYDFYSIGANQYGFVNASSDSGDGGWDVFGYTAQFGNGVSGTLSAEVQRRTRIFKNTRNGEGVGFNGGVQPLSTTAGINYEGHDYPDLVANLRVDQAWGSAQIMGALHNVAAQYYGGTEWSGHPDDKLGFAVGAGITLKAPSLGPGDYFTAEVDYTVGASRYSNMTAAVWDNTKFSGGEFGYGLNTDAVYGGALPATATGLELTTSWAVNAAYTHNWNTAWKTTLWGAYTEQNYSALANAMICSSLGDGAGRGSTSVANVGCDNDWSMWGLGLRTQWAISSTFYMGPEVMYANLQSATTSTGLINVAGFTAKPTTLYTIADQDIWAVRLRVHRDFYP